MQTRMVCAQCFDEWTKAGLPPQDIEAKLSKYWAPIQGTGISAWTCPGGHSVCFFLQAPFYSLLYNKGLTDLARLDTRTAVTSFYSSWENFVGDTASLLLRERAVDDIPGSINRAEPLLGMFTGLVAYKAGSYPELPPSEVTALRNKVAHRSLIPKEEEALKLAKAVQKCIRTTLDLLKPLHYNDVMGPGAAQRAQRAIEEAGPNDVVGLAIVFHAPQFDEDIEQKVGLIRRERAREGAL